MRNLLLMARREYLEQIRGRAFRVSTILVPVLFAGDFLCGHDLGPELGRGQAHCHRSAFC